MIMLAEVRAKLHLLPFERVSTSLLDRFRRIRGSSTSVASAFDGRVRSRLGLRADVSCSRVSRFDGVLLRLDTESA
jgi:hypothetical protein